MERKATARWEGNSKDGKGTLNTQSQALSELPHSFEGRFVDESGKSGTNPEELLAAAWAGCFNMAFTGILDKNNTPASNLETTATVKIEKQGEGFSVSPGHLEVHGEVEGIDQKTFEELARKAKVNCPVAKALNATEVPFKSTLTGGPSISAQA